MKSKSLVDKRMNELLLQRGNVTYRISNLQSQLLDLQKALKGLDKQLEALNESFPFLTLAEAELTKSIKEEKELNTHSVPDSVPDKGI